LKQKKLVIETDGFSQVIDLSDEISLFLADMEASGLLNVAVPGSTAGVTTIEYESGCIEDLQRALEEIAPQDREYKYNQAWGDGNGFSHLRSALLGPSVTLPFAEGTLQTGTWQQVVLVDNDNRPRNREVLLSILSA